MKKEWFAEWFDSPFYHLLYQNRDEQEAKNALDNLLAGLKLAPGSRVLDLGCGKGRHARYIAEKGYQVTGLDLSPANIQFARQYETPALEFYIHDMRKPFRILYFDAVMNMFTSFGYFKRDAEHLITLKNMAIGLRPGGIVVLDFLNASYLHQQLVPSEQKQVGNMLFSLKRWIRSGYVFKSIAFKVAGKSFRYKEQVRLFELVDFQEMFAASGLKLRQTYGAYDLSAYNPKASKRLILIAEKL